MIDLTPGTKDRLRALFRPEDVPEAERLLANDDTVASLAGQGWTPAQLERIQFAALRASAGTLEGLRQALVLGRADWRDLVMSAGFGNDPLAHQSWQPGPEDAVPREPLRPGTSVAGPRWEDLPPDDSPLRSRQVEVEGVSLPVLEGGAPGRRGILFLGGGSGSPDAFAEVMRELQKGFYVVALDLPSLGGTAGAPAANDERTLARSVKGTVAALGLEEVTLVGHGAGGEIVYAYLHAYPGELKRAVILSAAVPTGEDNLAVPGKPVTTPVLLVRGENEPGDLNAYAAGFRAGGLQRLRTATLPGAGSSGPGEQPAALATMLRQYVAATP